MYIHAFFNLIVSFIKGELSNMSNKFHLFALISTHMHLVLQQHDAKSRCDLDICCVTSCSNMLYNFTLQLVKHQSCETSGRDLLLLYNYYLSGFISCFTLCVTKNLFCTS